MHLLFKLSKGKGILIILYWMCSSIGSAVAIVYIVENSGGVFKRPSFSFIEGIAFLITALWTYLTKDDYYKDREGNKVKMDTVNAFAFIKMDVWYKIFIGIGLIFLVYSFFHHFLKWSI